MGRLIEALLGAFGLLKPRVRQRDKNATWDKFVKSCQACQRPGEYVVSFILTGNFDGNFAPDGIKAATDSAWAHALTCLWDQGDKIKNGFEIVESQELVAVDKLSKYKRDDVYMVTFSVSLDRYNFNQLKYNLYSQIGKPYDIAEFLKYLGGIFDAIPNPRDLHVCSTLTTYGVTGSSKYDQVYHRWFGKCLPLRLWPKNKDPRQVTPADIWAGCNPQYRFRRSFYNCK